MRFPLRRAGVLLLVLVLCLAVVGVGYGKWSGTLKIRGDMTTAASAIIVGWTSATNSDEFSALDDSCGWNWDDNKWIAWHDGHEGEDHKHVGKTTSYCDPATLITVYPDPPAPMEYELHGTVVVILENVYPCYAVEINPTLMNKGPLPAKVVSWTIYPDWGREEGYTYTFVPGAIPGTGAYECEDYPGSGVYTDRPYNIGFSDGSQVTLLPDCAVSEKFTMVVHVEEAALENTPYSFTIEVHAEPAY